jgi:hypothetical protein
MNPASPEYEAGALTHAGLVSISFLTVGPMYLISQSFYECYAV